MTTPTKEWYDLHGGKKNYQDNWAISKGYKNKNDYELERIHKNGKSIALLDNTSCSSYLGIIIAERVLSHVFDNVIRMPFSNPGYDFICKKGYKIDVKSACLSLDKTKSGIYYKWHFAINQNKTADFFLFLAFDNRKSLNPKHIWLINGNDIIPSKLGNKPLNTLVGLNIFNSNRSLNRIAEFEKQDKLIQTIMCCNILKEEV